MKKIPRFSCLYTNASLSFCLVLILINWFYKLFFKYACLLAPVRLKVGTHYTGHEHHRVENFLFNISKKKVWQSEHFEGSYGQKNVCTYLRIDWPKLKIFLFVFLLWGAFLLPMSIYLLVFRFSYFNFENNHKRFLLIIMHISKPQNYTLFPE